MATFITCCRLRIKPAYGAYLFDGCLISHSFSYPDYLFTCCFATLWVAVTQDNSWSLWWEISTDLLAVDSSADNGFVVTENTELMGEKAAAAAGGGGDLSLGPASSGLTGLGVGYRDFDSRSTSSLGVIPRPTPRSSTSYSGYERLPVQRHQIQLISLLGLYRTPVTSYFTCHLLSCRSFCRYTAKFCDIHTRSPDFIWDRRVL